MVVGVNVADAMHKSVVTMKPTDSAEKALKYMVDLDIGSVIVADKNKPVGIVTDSNLLERVFFKKLDSSKVKAKDIMSHPLRTVEENLDVEEVSRIMRDLGVKRLPVTRDGKLVGIITETDIISISPALFEIVRENVKMRQGIQDFSKDFVEGVCESCGNFSEKLVNKNGRLLCEDCR